MVSASDSTIYTKGILYVNGDASTWSGRYITLDAYDINNNKIGSFRDEGNWEDLFIILFHFLIM
jgi:hypothetical protein